MSQPKILAFAGSAREASFNKKLVKIASKGAGDAGAEVTVLDLRDYPMPLFDQDLEDKEGMPENAKKVKDLMLAHDGFLIAAPEHNSSITALLKNTIDWASRVESKDEPMLAVYQGKIAVLMSASPGGLGGLRGLVHVRSMLENIGVTVLPNQRAIGGAFSAFADDGNLKDEKQQKSILALGAELTNILKKLQ
jgi:chromate reductase